MNKRYKLIVFGAVIVGLLLGIGSCKKFRENREFFTVYDHSAGEEAYNDMFRLTCQEADRFSALLKDSCYTVTTNGDTAYPLTYNFNFGSTDCTDYYGIVRRGTMTITFKQNFSTTGAIATITPGSDYYFEDYKVQGSMTITNNGTDNNGKQLYGLAVSAANLITPQNQPFTWACNHIMKIYIPQPSLIFGDILHYTGTANGVDHEGFAYTVSITDSLVKVQSCRWPSYGDFNININTLDSKECSFNNSACEIPTSACCNNELYVKTGGKDGQDVHLP